MCVRVLLETTTTTRSFAKPTEVVCWCFCCCCQPWRPQTPLFSSGIPELEEHTGHTPLAAPNVTVTGQSLKEELCCVVLGGKFPHHHEKGEEKILG